MANSDTTDLFPCLDQYCDICTTRFVPCEACQTEGRRYTSRYGGNDPDVWDDGPCEECGGECVVEVQASLIKMEDLP